MRTRLEISVEAQPPLLTMSCDELIFPVCIVKSKVEELYPISKLQVRRLLLTARAAGPHSPMKGVGLMSFPVLLNCSILQSQGPETSVRGVMYRWHGLKGHLEWIVNFAVSVFVVNLDSPAILRFARSTFHAQQLVVYTCVSVYPCVSILFINVIRNVRCNEGRRWVGCVELSHTEYQ